MSSSFAGVSEGKIRRVNKQESFYCLSVECSTV